MAAREQFRKPDLVAVAFAHLSAVERDHIVVQPITGRYMFIADRTLRDLAFVMGELEVHSAAVNIELLTEVFSAHSRAFDMPAGKAFAPGALPTHDMLRRSGLP